MVTQLKCQEIINRNNWCQTLTLLLAHSQTVQINGQETNFMFISGTVIWILKPFSAKFKQNKLILFVFNDTIAVYLPIYSHDDG